MPQDEPTVITSFDFSDATSVEMQWHQFEAIVPIDKNRELTQLILSVENHSDIGAYYDDLAVLKNLTNDKLLAQNIIFMPIEEIADGTPLERIVFGAPDLSEIIKVSYVPEEAIIGSATAAQLSIKHTITGGILCTKTFLEGTDAPKGEVVDFGPVSQTGSDVLAANSVMFVKSSQGKLPRGVLIVQWDLS